jgi:hypothetical protein
MLTLWLSICIRFFVVNATSKSYPFQILPRLHSRPHGISVQIMFHIEKAHYIVDEMVANGAIVENNKANILKPLALMDKSSQEESSIFNRR